ncbi:MAG: hypothetical protein O2971_07400 [Proteobacteria bacterium]|nr:hypothetical protein [Pseudomonadota bacterium]
MMNFDKFEKLLNVHGADSRSWPSELRRSCTELLDSSRQVRALLASHQLLEKRLNQLPVPELASLEATVMHQPLPARSLSPMDRLLDWLAPTEGFTLRLWRPTIAACLPLVFGIVLGNYYSFGVMVEPSELEFWEDELAMLSLDDYSENNF